nr:MAG TPA: hypothetical protein [Caudoviricetes sp.]
MPPEYDPAYGQSSPKHHSSLSTLSRPVKYPMPI